MDEIFRAGDRVQLTGPKGRLNTITLYPGGKFGTHKGDILHDEIIGKPEGSVVSSDKGSQYLALKPLLTDYVLSMPRGAAIIYPKDAAQIIVEADIYPGATVVEAGVGSGALSSYLLRAVSEKGRLISFERREEFAQIARGNVKIHLGEEPKNWSVVTGDLQDKLAETLGDGEADRVVLDMLAPWECIDAVAKALRPGGVLVCYVATVTQLSRTVEQIRSHTGFTDPESWETLVRPWHIEGLAVRPEHRMIGHTAFLVMARRLAPDTVLPVFKVRRASKSEYSDEDMEIWNPGSLGERSVSEKKLRKTVRKVTNQAANK